MNSPYYKHNSLPAENIGQVLLGLVFSLPVPEILTTLDH
jgi:hypothetical protein